MAHNTRTRADLTAWSSATAAVTPAEMDKLDGYSFKSINGDDGGVWAPASAIVIGGAGLQVTGHLQVPGSSTFDGSATFNNLTYFTDGVYLLDDVTASGPTFVIGTFGGTVCTINAETDFYANVTVNAGTLLTVLGDMQIGDSSGDDLTVNATADFNAHATFEAVDINGTLITHGTLQAGTSDGDLLDVRATADFKSAATFEEAAYFNGNVTIGNSGADALEVVAPATFDGFTKFLSDVVLDAGVQIGNHSTDVIDVRGAVTLKTVLGFADNGRVILRAVAAPDANRTYKVTDANLIHVNALSASRTYSISDEGAQDGDFFIIATTANGSNVTVASPTILYTITNQNSTTPAWVMLVRIAGLWRVAMRYQ